MKINRFFTAWRRLGLVLLCLSNVHFLRSSFGQDTTFTYQGRLADGSAVANGSYDLTFSVWTNETGPAQVAGTITNAATAITNGIFTVVLDFGPGVFTGADRWLEISVRANGTGSFFTLQPRQKLTATPYAIMAGTASNLSGTISDSQVPTNVARLDANNNFTGTNGLNDADLRLRVNSNIYHGLGWYGGSKTFGGAAPDGPVLFGYNGGALGLTSVGHTELFWNHLGVGIGPGFTSPQDLLHVQSPTDVRVWAETTNAGFAGFLTKNSLAGWFMGVDYGTSWFLEENFPQTRIPLVVTSGGNVGIGTNNPGTSLEVNGGIRARGGPPGAFGFSNNGYAFNGIGDTDSGMFSSDNGQIEFYNNSVEAMRIMNGNVGIGATNPAAKLDVRGGSILTDSVLGFGNVQQAPSPSSTYLASPATNTLALYTASLEQLRVASNGNVGIGTVNPGTKLDVRGGGVLTDNFFGFSSVQQGAVPVSTYIGAPAGDTLSFYTASTERLRVSAAGNVGIGASNPQAGLHVNNSMPTTAMIESAYTAGTWLNLQNDAGGRNWGLISTGSGNGEGPGQFLVRDNNLAAVRMIIQTNGNVGIGTITPTNRLHVAGGVSATDFVTTSDRNAKENFAAVNPRQVLDKVAALPITTWNFKELSDGRHMGPVAQDFYAAFGLGGGDTTITTVDPAGVAFAAIQGLNQKVDELRNELKRKDAENRALEAAFGLDGADDKHISTVDEEGVALAAIQGLNQKVELENAALWAENAELRARLEKLEQLINVQNGGRK